MLYDINVVIAAPHIPYIGTNKKPNKAVDISPTREAEVVIVKFPFEAKCWVNVLDILRNNIPIDKTWITCFTSENSFPKINVYTSEGKREKKIKARIVKRIFSLVIKRESLFA